MVVEWYYKWFQELKWSRPVGWGYIGWNDKIIALEKTTWFHFHLMKAGFLFFCFFVADHLLVGQLCTNPKSDRSLLLCLKVTQCSTSEIGDAPLYNHALYWSKLWQQNHCQYPQDANPDGSTCPGWWKQSFRLRLWFLVWFQVRATSCHFTTSKSAWKSTPKCTWMCWRVCWSPGAIRWPVADPECGNRTRRRPTSPKRPRLDFRRSATTLYPSLTSPLLPRPELAGLLRLVIRREHHQHDLPQHQSQPDRRVFAELPPARVENACSQFRIRIEAVIEAEGGYIE